MGGDTNPSFGEGKHKSSIVVEWRGGGGRDTAPFCGRVGMQIHLVAGWVVEDFSQGLLDNKFQLHNLPLTMLPHMRRQNNYQQVVDNILMIFFTGIYKNSYYVHSYHKKQKQSFGCF